MKNRIAQAIGLALSLTALSAAEPQSGQASRLPNIVITFSDNMGYGNLGCYGCPDIETPVIDAYLFDLETDPGEQRNLLDDDAKEARRLKGLLEDRESEVDPGPWSGVLLDAAAVSLCLPWKHGIFPT